MGDHKINTFDDTPSTPKPLVCVFCGEKLHESTYREGFVICKEAKGPEGEGDVFFLDNYQITKDPPPWFRQTREKKPGSGCMAVFLVFAAAATLLGWLCVT